MADETLADRLEALAKKWRRAEDASHANAKRESGSADKVHHQAVGFTYERCAVALEQEIAAWNRRAPDEAARGAWLRGAEAMREEAAKVCAREAEFWKGSDTQYEGDSMARKLANVIRAMQLSAPPDAAQEDK